MKIVQLQAENYKRLKAVSIKPDGNVVVIGGRNAQGKTSVLDAIWAALAGGDASRATQQPIRDGQDTAVVTLDLGDYKVTRRWTKDDAGTLTVTAADGAKYSSPQKLLDDVIGARAFDPLAFTRMSVRDQVATLVSTVDLPFDPAVLERERSGVFDQRTEINRMVKQLEGQLSGMAEPDDDLPTEEVSAADIIAEFEKAREHNTKIQRASDMAAECDRQIEGVDRLLADLKAKLAQAEKDRIDLVARRDAALADADASERIDTDSISARLTDVEKTNAAIREGQEWRRVAEHLAVKRNESAQFTAKLAQIDKQKAEALAAVTFPIPGLSFDETGVTYNGIPFSQASSAEQLRVSVALAMAANPTLRVLRILDGSLLDSESMQLITDMATEHEYQVWVEVVDESGEVGIVIEDGQIRE